MELHLPSFPQKGEHVPGGSFNNTMKYSYAGPGTNFIKRITEGYQGINELDKAAKEHDAAYHFYKDRETRTKSDRILAEKAYDIAQDASKSGYEKAMASFVYKTFTNGGIADRLQGKGYDLRNRKQVSYSENKENKASCSAKYGNRHKARSGWS